jgi:hypothetical protein
MKTKRLLQTLTVLTALGCAQQVLASDCSSSSSSSSSWLNGASLIRHFEAHNHLPPRTVQIVATTRNGTKGPLTFYCKSQNGPAFNNQTYQSIISIWNKNTGSYPNDAFGVAICILPERAQCASLYSFMSGNPTPGGGGGNVPVRRHPF